MEINLRDILGGEEIDSTDPNRGDSILKAYKFVNDISVIGGSYKPNMNFLIVPMSIFNIIEFYPKFIPKFNRSNELESLFSVGSIPNFEIYLDLYMPSDEVILYWDKQMVRDNKINSILDDFENHNELIIDVII